MVCAPDTVSELKVSFSCPLLHNHEQKQKLTVDARNGLSLIFSLWSLERMTEWLLIDGIYSHYRNIL